MLQFFLGTSQPVDLAGTVVSAAWTVAAGSIDNGSNLDLPGVAVSAAWTVAAGSIANGADNDLGSAAAVSAAWTVSAGTIANGADNVLGGTAVSAAWSTPSGQIDNGSNNFLIGVVISAAWSVEAGSIYTDQNLTGQTVSAEWTTPAGTLSNTPADTLVGVAVSAEWSVPSGLIAAASALAAPLLAIEDNADNTGALATITGSVALANNAVSVLPVDGSFGSSAMWQIVAVRTGDGTAQLPIAPGFYWGIVASELGSAVAVSNLVYFQVTTGDDPVLEQCLLAAEARIRLLDLEPFVDKAGIAHELEILVQKVPSDRNLDGRPFISISPYGTEVLSPSAGTNERDDIGYPILIVASAPDNRDQGLSRSIIYGWRERIRRAFNQQRLTGVDEVFTCFVEPGIITVPDAFLNQSKNVQAMVLRFYSRETRGLAPA